jgi:hypothetical protein
MEQWMALYQAVARGNKGEPDAGRLLYGWAQQAGFSEVRASASVWCFATPDERAWWAGLWAERVTRSALAEQAVDRGLATTADLEAMAAGWRAWAAADDGWFAVLHGEVLCTP